MEEESFVDFRRARQNGRIRRYSREELLAIGRKPGLTGLPQGVNMSVIRELEELTFFDSGPKPDWNKEKPPGYGRLDFLRPGGGPIRSRLVADGSLPDELPPARSVDLLGPTHSTDGPLDIRRSSSWRPGGPEGGSGHTPQDRWNAPTTPGRRLVEDVPPRRGTRWDEGKTGTTPERDSWRSGVPPSPSNADDRWRPGLGPSGGPPGSRPPGNRWGDDEWPRGAGWGPRGSLDEREAPRRPPPGMGHDEKWAPRGPPGWEGHEGRSDWAGRRDPGGGGGGHWERDPAWMHDGQEAGRPITASRTLMPPPPSRTGMTAKDIERERQEMQAQWRAEAAANKAKDEDDMAFLRSDSDDEQPPPPPAPPAPPSRTGSGPASRQGSQTMLEQGGGSHPARSRFFDVPSVDSGGHPHHPQPGTPSAAAAEVVGKKLTFDQFKQAAAAGGAASPSLGPPMGPLDQPPPPPPVPTGSKVLTIAELEHQMSGGPFPPPPAPAGAGESRVADKEASKKLMAFLKKPGPPPGAGPGAAARQAPQQPAPPAAPQQQQQRPVQPSPPSARAPAPGPALFPPPGLPNTGNAAAAAAAAAGLKPAAAAPPAVSPGKAPAEVSALPSAADDHADEDITQLAGLLHLGLEDDSSAATGLAAKLAGLSKGSTDALGSTFGNKTEASALSPTLGGFESMLSGAGKVPAALAGIWGTGLGVWDHAPKSTGSGPSLVPLITSSLGAAASAAAPGGGAAAAGSASISAGTAQAATYTQAAANSNSLVVSQAASAAMAAAAAAVAASSAGGLTSPHALTELRPPALSVVGLGGPAVPAASAGLKPASGPGSGALGPSNASSAAGIASSNPLAALLASAAAGAPGTAGSVGAPAMGLANGATGFGVNRQPQAARLGPALGAAAGAAAQLPAGMSGGMANNPLAVLLGQAKQQQQQQVAAAAARPAALNPLQQLQQQQQVQAAQQQQQQQQQVNLAGLMQQVQQQQLAQQQQQQQQQQLAAGRAFPQQQQMQFQQQQQQRAAATGLGFPAQQMLGAGGQPQQNLQFLLQQQQQQQAAQQQQQQFMLAQQLAAQNQAALQAANLARSAGMGVAGAGMPGGSQFLPNAQLPAAYGAMAGQRPAAAQAGFRLGAVDQQAQLRQLLSQAQQRVPGMP